MIAKSLCKYPKNILYNCVIQQLLSHNCKKFQENKVGHYMWIPATVENANSTVSHSVSLSIVSKIQMTSKISVAFPATPIKNHDKLDNMQVQNDTLPSNTCKERNHDYSDNMQVGKDTPHPLKKGQCRLVWHGEDWGQYWDIIFLNEGQYKCTSDTTF